MEIEENKAKNNPVGGSQTLNMNLDFSLVTADYYPWEALFKKPTLYNILFTTILQYVWIIGSAVNNPPAM